MLSQPRPFARTGEFATLWFQFIELNVSEKKFNEKFNFVTPGFDWRYCGAFSDCAGIQFEICDVSNLIEKLLRCFDLKGGGHPPVHCVLEVFIGDAKRVSVLITLFKCLLIAVGGIDFIVKSKVIKLAS